MDLVENTHGRGSISVSLCVPAFDRFKTANLLSENLCRSESSHGSFITKYSLVIKGNGAGKVRDPEYGALPAWMSCRRETSLISHCTLHEGYTSEAPWCISVDGTGGSALSDGLWRQPSSFSLFIYLCGPLSSFSLCQQLLITPHWGVGHAWVSSGSPRSLLLLPNLSSSGDRNELPTTIGAATVWWRGCRLPQGAKTPSNWRSESVTPPP